MDQFRDIVKKALGLTDEQIKEATEHAAKAEISLTHAIELLEFVPVEKYLEIMGKIYRVPHIRLDEKEIPRAIVELIPREVAMKFKVIPVSQSANEIVVAMADPRELETINSVRFKTGLFARPVLAAESHILEALAKYYGRSNMDLAALEKQGQDLETAIDVLGVKRKDIGSGGADTDGPIIKLVNYILLEAQSRGASDIHIEPYETYVRVRLRIDGVLRELTRPPANMKAGLISRIKIMSRLDIAESRLPQDGAINILISSNPVDYRVSTLPTFYGEKIVMRILDKSALKVDMTQLGLDQDQLDKFMNSIHSPFGMVLVTGPTGSGKTTTLYSALSELNQESDNIMTAEDPVEYNIEGINQVQTKPEIGLTFAEALKSFLRQDPDVIMVGEIRDLETAEIAVKAALTGHMVLSTLHTNSAPDTIHRLLNMGVESFNLVSALNCITAQRLIRKICVKCKTVDDSVTPDMLIRSGIASQFVPRIKPMKGTGCGACSNTGNKGRIAVHEVLKVNDAIRQAIMDGAASMDLKKVAMANGMRTLRQSALMKMAAGQVSFNEAISNTASDDDNDQLAVSAA
ncbi:type IV-A pilus assembly ATPase PilB [bacterium]|nr:type IV-A pilus assembly ATPase PilB [bacterium]